MTKKEYPLPTEIIFKKTSSTETCLDFKVVMWTGSHKNYSESIDEYGKKNLLNFEMLRESGMRRWDGGRDSMEGGWRRRAIDLDVVVCYKISRRRN